MPSSEALVCAEVNFYARMRGSQVCQNKDGVLVLAGCFESRYWLENNS